MELVGIARSYFGGFLCVCWSPDGKYIVVGGEDDLVTVYSFAERRVVARGQGHRSWVSVVAFDPYTTFSSWDTNDFSDDENQYEMSTSNNNNKRVRSASIRDSTIAPDKLICYRLGSVSQDTQLCLWDITEDILRPHHRVRLSTLDPQQQQSHPHTNINNNNCKAETVQMMNGDCSTGSGIAAAAATAVVDRSSTPLIKDTIDTNLSNSHTTTTSSTTKLNSTNCDGAAAVVVVTDTGTIVKKGKSTSLASVVGNSSNSNLSATKINNNNTSAATTMAVSMTTPTTTTSVMNSQDDKSNNHSAFNTLTQRFTNFSFGSDKSSKGKRNFSLTGKSSAVGSSVDQKLVQNCDGNSATSTLRNKSNGSIVTSYDPMKLIGTPACPRFDDCPVLEPLICKKIAHERLTALIFREDCFLTACQDGFVYTWARPVSSFCLIV